MTTVMAKPVDTARGSGDPKPSGAEEEWKNALRQRIEREFHPLIEEAREKRAQRLNVKGIDDAERKRIEEVYEAEMKSFRRLAEEQFREAEERRKVTGGKTARQYSTSSVSAQQAILAQIQRHRKSSEVGERGNAGSADVGDNDEAVEDSERPVEDPHISSPSRIPPRESLGYFIDEPQSYFPPHIPRERSAVGNIQVSVGKFPAYRSEEPNDVDGDWSSPILPYPEYVPVSRKQSSSSLASRARQDSGRFSVPPSDHTSSPSRTMNFAGLASAPSPVGSVRRSSNASLGNIRSGIAISAPAPGPSAPVPVPHAYTPPLTSPYSPYYDHRHRDTYEENIGHRGRGDLRAGYDMYAPDAFGDSPSQLARVRKQPSVSDMPAARRIDVRAAPPILHPASSPVSPELPRTPDSYRQGTSYTSSQIRRPESTERGIPIPTTRPYLPPQSSPDYPKGSPSSFGAGRMHRGSFPGDDISHYTTSSPRNFTVRRQNSSGSRRSRRSVGPQSPRDQHGRDSDMYSRQALESYHEQSATDTGGSDDDETFGVDTMFWRQDEELERMVQDVRRKEEEARQIEQEAKRKAEEARLKEEEARLEAKRIEEEARRKEEELKRKEDELLRREEELRRREEIARKENELKQRELELEKREAEAMARFRELEEKKRREQEEEDRRVAAQVAAQKAQEEESRRLERMAELAEEERRLNEEKRKLAEQEDALRRRKLAEEQKREADKDLWEKQKQDMERQATERRMAEEKWRILSEEAEKCRLAEEAERRMRIAEEDERRRQDAEFRRKQEEEEAQRQSFAFQEGEKRRMENDRRKADAKRRAEQEREIEHIRPLAAAREARARAEIQTKSRAQVLEQQKAKLAKEEDDRRLAQQTQEEEDRQFAADLERKEKEDLMRQEAQRRAKVLADQEALRRVQASRGSDPTSHSPISSASQAAASSQQSSPWAIPGHRQGSTASTSSTNGNNSDRTSATSSSWESGWSGWSNTSGSTHTSHTSQNSTSSRTPHASPSTPHPPKSPANATASPTTKQPPKSSSTGTGTAWRKATSTFPPSPASPHPDTHTKPPVSEEERLWKERQSEHARRQQEQFQQQEAEKQRERMLSEMEAMSKDAVVRIFEQDEHLWSQLNQMDVLFFRSFPWPMLKKPNKPDDLTAEAISLYMLNPHTPVNRSAKDLLRDNIRRWHPDRFNSRYLAKVVDSEREAVQAGAAAVIQNLNELLNKPGI